MLTHKKVVLGISGSIAAYKSVYLTRSLIKAGAEVQVLMTSAATRFISPLTLSTLSQKPVFHDVASEEGWNNHVEIGLWADAYLIAPATANTLARMAQGICDNMLLATYLSARCPVFVAPAMDLDMWTHPSTLRNIQCLQQDGVHLLPVGEGELASGLYGKGRMAEPEEILHLLEQFFAQTQTLTGKKILITAGPTHEPIDPVRFIGNNSSGKMGIAIAECLARRGATVELLLGPTHLRPSLPQIKVIAVQTAEEMMQAAASRWPHAHVGIMTAAVSDYRPKQKWTKKLKKKDAALDVALIPNPDIAATLGQQKGDGQILIGFALETDNEFDNARSKMNRKNFDFIVLNSLQDKGAGFQKDTNKITLLFPDGKKTPFPTKPKTEVAEDIADALEKAMGIHTIPPH